MIRRGSSLARHVHIESKIASLKYMLPSMPPEPKGNYAPYTLIGDMVYLSGHLPIESNGNLITGRLGDKDGGLSIEEGKHAAEMAGLNLLASLRHACNGDLDKVVKVVKVVGFVNSHSTFTGQAQVINGCSDLIVNVFGEDIGRHARAALGTSVLPLGVPVEIEAIVQIDGNKRHS